MNVIGTSAVLSAIERLRVDESPGYVVGTNVEYAPYVEFGTSRMGAQPYLRPAAEQGISNAGAHFKRSNGLEAAIKLIALDIEKNAKRRCPVDTGNLKNSIAAEKA